MTTIVRRVFRSLEARRQRRRTERLARRLEQDPGYAFTEDYVSEHADSWPLTLGELRDVPDVRMLEIGSFEGRSAVWFLENLLTHPGAHLVCVDPFVVPGQELRFDHNLRRSGEAPRVTKIKGFSGSVLPSLEDASFDLVYVDGSHRAGDVLLDGVLAWRLLKPGGLMLFDDYLWQTNRPAHERPQMAVDLLLDHLEGHCRVELKDYQVLIRKTVLPSAAV